MNRLQAQKEITKILRELEQTTGRAIVSIDIHNDGQRLGEPILTTFRRN